MHPFCVKVSQRENEWQASFTSTAYIRYFWVLVIASYFSPIVLAARLAVFLREPATGTWPARAKGLIGLKVKYYRLLRAIGSTEPISFRDMIHVALVFFASVTSGRHLPMSPESGTFFVCYSAPRSSGVIDEDENTRYSVLV